jgi:CBS-domain-containing membrane protein
MAKARVGALPVIDVDGDVIGILSVTDVLAAAVEPLLSSEA